MLISNINFIFLTDAVISQTLGKILYKGFLQILYLTIYIYIGTPRYKIKTLKILNKIVKYSHKY